MKIKLVILEKDINYSNRFTNIFSVKYAENIEVYAFKDKELALEKIKSEKIDVFIASDVFEINVESLPLKCCFAYFVDSPDIETVNGQHVICKFQKIDLIYKQILSLYAEQSNHVMDLKLGDGMTKVIAFSSPSGGVGSSTLAAACAVYFAKRNKKVLYLNLEKFGSADRFFSGEGQFDMSDVIFAIKSKKSNLLLKLESSVKTDVRGVDFYSETKNAMDMLELQKEECMQLLSELKISGTYDFIILDVDFEIGKDVLSFYSQINSMIWSGDGSDISNGKIARAYQVMSMMESEVSLTSKISLIYNKFSNKTGKMLQNVDLKNMAGIPRVEHADTQQIVEYISKLGIFDEMQVI